MHRRTFLGSMAVPLGTLVEAGEPPRTRIAFVGGAHPHTPAKLQIVRQSPRYEFMGLCEDDPAVRARYPGVPVIGRAEALQDPSIRIVAVGSAVKDHARDARQALAAGKHIHVEKPPATTLDDFRGIQDLAARKRLLLQVGYMWRYNPALKAALEAARQGWLGEVHTVRGTIDSTTPTEERPALAAFAGGQMFELGCHLLDAAVRLLGRPLRVSPFVRKHGAFDDRFADNAVAVLEYPHAFAVITSSALRPNAFRQRFFEVMGSRGTAMVRPIEPPVLELDLAQAAGPYPAARSTVKLPPYTRYTEDFAELEEAVRTGRPLSITPEEELLVHETLLKACGM